MKSCSLCSFHVQIFTKKLIQYVYVNTVGLVLKIYSVPSIDVTTRNYPLHEYPISVPLPYRGFIPLYLELPLI